MTGHRIYARHSAVETADRLDITLIKRCVRAALSSECVDLPCEVSVLITNDRAIREINREYRGVDAPTDVLSFPMQELRCPGWNGVDTGSADPESGLIPLGEIVLSADRVAKQARLYGRTVEYETAYLTVHSVLHLLGYDHIDEAEDKKIMRKQEKLAMKDLVNTL